MRRVPVLGSVVTVVLLGTLVVGRSTLGTAAQDAPPAATMHPLVGSWVAANPAEPSRPVLLATFWADGNALFNNAGGGVSHGAWAATGPRTAVLTVVAIAIETEGGPPVGRDTLSATVEVNAAGGAFRLEGDIEGVRMDGTLLATAHLEMVATRVAAQPAGAPESSTPAQDAAPASTSAQDATPAGGAPGTGDHPYHFDETGHFPWDPAAVAHHWCRPVAGGFLECLVYTSDAPDAPLAAVELVVEPTTYRGFDPAEQRLWHPVESNYGKLILLGEPDSLDGLPAGQPRVIGTEPGTPTP